MIRRPMCCFCISLALGMLCVRIGDLRILALFCLFLFCLAVTLTRFFHPARSVVIGRIILCICLFFAGAARMQSQQTVRDELSKAAAQGERIIVEGRVSRREESEGRRQKFRNKEPKQQFLYYLTDVRILPDGKSYPGYSILLYSKDGRYQPGNVLRAAGRQASFQISRNQGNFSEKQYQQSRKRAFRVYADRENLISDKKDGRAIFLKSLQKKIRKVYETNMKETDAGVMANLTLGDKSLLDTEIKELYQSCGISHILAISGLHVSLFGMGALRLLQKLRCPQKAGLVLAAGAACGFGIFSGMEVSTARAVGMFALLMASQAAGYSYDSLTALSVCAMAQLWGNPFLLEYAGFLFSYAAVLGVAGAAKIWRDSRGEARREKALQKENEAGKKAKMRQNKKPFCRFLQTAAQKGRETMLASVCIQLVSLPLSLYFYYEIPCYSVMVNACILPFLGILLFLGVAGGTLGMFAPMAGAWILKPAGWMLAVNEGLCRTLQELPGASLIIGKPSFWQISVYYGLFVCSLYLIWKRKKCRYAMGILLAAVCILFSQQKPRFEISVLDVGQGDGICIQNEKGDCFFVDGGSSDVRQVGKYRILPFLKSRGIRSVKGWIVSHGDADHISGLMEALEQGYPVKNLILARGMVRDEAMDQLVQAAKKAGVRILYVEPGMKFGSGDTVFTVLAPKAGQAKLDCGEQEEQAQTEDGRGGKDRNASSLAFVLECRGFTGVFTGDIGSAQEKALAESGVFDSCGQVDFYKAAHHGSDHSNSREFMETVSPRITVVSCGADNSYGHPGKEAVSRILASGSRIFYTMEQGQIDLLPKEGEIQIWTYLPEMVYDRN